jgi:hypothetical protein
MDSVSPTRGQQDRAAAIAAELASLGFALPGTLIQRHVRCGKPRCRCHADPPVLHGPYWQWTRKTGGKTVTRLVPDDQLDDYRQWLDNHRRLRALVAELEALTLAIADADPRARRRHPAPPATPRKPVHNTVAAPRSNCGQARDQPLFPHVTAKCEDLTRPLCP